MSKKVIRWTTEQVKLGDLVEWEHNPVHLSPHDAEQIQISLEKFGLVLPLVANRPVTKDSIKRRLIDGHQRKTILVLSKITSLNTKLDVRIPSRKLTDRECTELSIRLRKNTGEFDYGLLAEDFAEDDLLDWGFQKEELGIDAEDIDYDKEWEGMPEFEREQLAHRIIYVHFNNEENVQDFAELIEQNLTEKTRSIWYPKKKRDTKKDTGYISDEI